MMVNSWKLQLFFLVVAASHAWQLQHPTNGGWFRRGGRPPRPPRPKTPADETPRQGRPSILCERPIRANSPSAAHDEPSSLDEEADLLLVSPALTTTTSAASSAAAAAAAAEVSKDLHRLLDDAVWLHHCILHQTNNHPSSSWLWMADQVSSLINCMADCAAIVPIDARTAVQLAIEIERVFALTQSTSSSSSLDELLQLYRRAQQWEDNDGGRAETVAKQLQTVQHQLTQFAYLLESLEGSSTTDPTASSQQPQHVLSSSTDPPKEHQPQPPTSRSSAGRQPFSSSSSSSASSTTALHAVRDEKDAMDYLEDDDDDGVYVPFSTRDDNNNEDDDDDEVVVVDVAIVGAGLAGLCAGAVLNTLYNQTVAVYESHYLPGGCAHAFDRKSSMVPNTTFTLDSGPTILLGCSSPPFNALRQVLDAINERVEWIPYEAWGMIEHPGQSNREERWRVELGPSRFEQGPLQRFGGPTALQEFQELRDATKDLLAGANIPAMAMRPGPKVLLPLLRYFPTLFQLLAQGELATGTFAPFLDGPKYVVSNPWLRDWLDALAFSLSGLPAARTAAAAMAFVLYDMHRPGASLDYPKGGMGSIVDALVRGVQSGTTGSKLHLRQHVEQINVTPDGSRVTGLTLRNGQSVRTRLGVICNAPVWSLRQLLLANERALERLGGIGRPSGLPAESSWDVGPEGASIRLDRPTPTTTQGTARDSSASSGVLPLCDSAEQTGSFLHLHLALNATGLDLDALEAHYTVMDRGLSGDGSVTNGVRDGPCGELNMIAVSNPCVLDRTLAPEGFIVVHAYGAANEPYQRWQGLTRNSLEYKALKHERAQVLWRAVESVIPDARSRAVLELIGSPLTHERFLRRPRGTYGSATEDYLKDGSTSIDNLVLANDGVFPGIGVPAVCIAGASAANAFVPVLEQWSCLDRLQRDAKI